MSELMVEKVAMENGKLPKFITKVGMALEVLESGMLFEFNNPDDQELSDLSFPRMDYANGFLKDTYSSGPKDLKNYFVEMFLPVFKQVLEDGFDVDFTWEGFAPIDEDDKEVGFLVFKTAELIRHCYKVSIQSFYQNRGHIPHDLTKISYFLEILLCRKCIIAPHKLQPHHLTGLLSSPNLSQNLFREIILDGLVKYHDVDYYLNLPHIQNEYSIKRRIKEIRDECNGIYSVYGSKVRYLRTYRNLNLVFDCQRHLVFDLDTQSYTLFSSDSIIFEGITDENLRKELWNGGALPCDKVSYLENNLNQIMSIYKKIKLKDSFNVVQ